MGRLLYTLLLAIAAWSVVLGADWDCHAQFNTDIAKNVFKGQMANLDACKAACSSTKSCWAVVWNSGNSHCNLKVGTYTYHDFLTSLKKSNVYETCGDRTSRPGPGPQPGPYMPAGGCNPKYKFCDASLSFAERAAELASLMTLPEKITQLSTYSFTSNHSGRTPAVERLGVPQYNYHTEGLHGIRTSSVGGFGNSTLFPQVTGMAATGNLSLVFAMAEVMGAEFRAVNNAMRSQGKIASKGGGLSVYGPTINIIRDGRWGRNQESVSEDPYFAGLYAANFIRGVQGDVNGEGKGYLRIAATCKHLAAYSVETSRHNSNAVVSNLDLHETYLPAFQACVAAEPQQLMCSYNKINGLAACLHDDIQNGIVRKQWGFKGSIVSDCDAVKDVTTAQKAMDGPTAVGKALAGGCDQDCGSFYGEYGLAALEKGTVTEAQIDTALQRTLEMRFRLGEFGDPAPYAGVPAEVVGSAKHLALAEQAAQEAITLLKNSVGVLPLKRSASIALIGPLADSSKVHMGGKSDYDCGGPPHVNCQPITVKEALLKATSASVSFVPGLKSVTDTSKAQFAAATKAAKAADITVLVLGVDSTVEMEGHDRNIAALTGAQGELLKEVVAAVGIDNVVLVFLNGGPIYIDPARLPAAVVEAYELGKYGGAAVVDALYGVVNPSGVLPYTMYYPNVTDKLPMQEFTMRSNASYPGRTYRFSTAPVAFPFGAGLSYTNFSLAWKSAPTECTTSKLHDGLDFAVEVKNVGTVAGAKVLQVFAGRDAVKGMPTPPIKTLFGVDKVFLAAGASTTITFSTKVVSGVCPLCMVDFDGSSSLKAGSLQISVGAEGALNHKLTVTGRSQPVGSSAGAQAQPSLYV